MPLPRQPRETCCIHQPKRPYGALRWADDVTALRALRRTRLTCLAFEAGPACSATSAHARGGLARDFDPPRPARHPALPKRPGQPSPRSDSPDLPKPAPLQVSPTHSLRSSPPAGPAIRPSPLITLIPKCSSAIRNLSPGPHPASSAGWAGPSAGRAAPGRTRLPTGPAVCPGAAGTGEAPVSGGRGWGGLKSQTQGGGLVGGGGSDGLGWPWARRSSRRDL